MNNFKRIFSTLLLILLSVFLLCGCLRPSNVDEYGYVLTIGVDKGKQYKYEISFMMQGATNEGGQTKSSSPIIVSAEGDSILDAIYIAESGLPYRLDFARVNLIIISQDVAQSDMLVDLLSVSWSILKVRTSTDLMICTAPTRTFLEGLKLTESINLSKLENSLKELCKSDGRTITISLSEFISALNDSRFDAVLPLGGLDESISNNSTDEQSKETPSPTGDTTDGVFRQGGMKSFASGAALFSGSKMVGVLSGDEAQLLLMARGLLESATVSLQRDDGSVFIVRIGNIVAPTVTFAFNPNPQIHYNIVLAARLEMDNSQEFIERMRNEGGLDNETENLLIDSLQSGVRELFYNCQQLNCDAFGVGKYASMAFSDASEWENYDFSKKLGEVDATFTVEVEMENIYVSSYMD